MKRIFLLLLVVASVAPVWADQKLAASKNCMTCHAVDKKLVGPSYRDIATKYAGQNATDKIATKIMNGGANVWGPVPMPANTQVSEAEAQQLAKWILSIN